MSVLIANHEASCARADPCPNFTALLFLYSVLGLTVDYYSSVPLQEADRWNHTTTRYYLPLTKV